MNKHFENLAAAEADLRAHGFKPLKNGRWANSICAAVISPCFDSWVLVGYWLVENHPVSA